MAQKLEVPKFSSEAEEARWWFENQDAVADEFELAEQEERLGHGTVARRMGLGEPVFLLEPDDVELARRQAKSRGMEYQAYLKMVVHRALLIEEKIA
jgi:hypothetical protein